MENSLSDGLFQKFSHLIYEQSGIHLHEGKKALLQARINKRLRANGISCYQDYYHYLVSSTNREELAHFLDCISTNLTHFFREVQHFQFLDEVLLPRLLNFKRKRRDNRIRIWSAGCSTGEEPYSLAMCLTSHLQDLGRWDFRILATDISTRVLQIASTGVYSQTGISKVPMHFRREYLQPCKNTGNGPNWEIVPALKNIVAFRRLNLKDPYPFKGPFDFIFCRNVMIYFDKQTQETLIQRISAYLPPGGHLFVGHSESLTGLNHSLTYIRPAVYGK